uniref:Parathyroid hormone-like hormone a n=2 Tax=Tetraodon nigroviridis TaxID=99883 RepID=H3C4J1_TETNG
RRSVAHTQLMHDKGRTLQDFKRRMWLQELLDDVHTADIRELAVRTQPRAPAGAKDAALAFQPEDQEGTKLPQESHQSTGHKDGGGLLKLPDRKKKKVRSGKRRDGEKRRRGRSLGWLKKDLGRGLRLEWRPLLGGL